MLAAVFVCGLGLRLTNGRTERTLRGWRRARHRSSILCPRCMHLHVHVWAARKAWDAELQGCRRSSLCTAPPPGVFYCFSPVSGHLWTQRMASVPRSYSTHVRQRGCCRVLRHMRSELSLTGLEHQGCSGTEREASAEGRGPSVERQASGSRFADARSAHRGSRQPAFATFHRPFQKTGLHSEAQKTSLA